jgi:hypothetical protein
MVELMVGVTRPATWIRPQWTIEYETGGPYIQSGYFGKEINLLVMPGS